ncbi:hypothetical protein SEA_GODONK_120 [Gordonia phage GodonK]|uniref:Uncharacterized protein n=1 Tax=Gordonia phage GodonK TaxID=2562192 RepID=A0A4D6E244_9CAUD|nr:hypothetical protein HOV33_gp120 [Gordonia phage GodonK]QBZ72739.1 hypothetical protein SEA_GODONK_120 [Gordonia phage GodonK]
MTTVLAWVGVASLSALAGAVATVLWRMVMWR